MTMRSNSTSDFFQKSIVFEFTIHVQILSVDLSVAVLSSSEQHGILLFCQGFELLMYSCDQLLKVRSRSQLPLVDCE